MKNYILLISSAFFYLISPVSYAKTNNDLLLNLTHCSTMSNDGTRLACFDKLVSHSAMKPVVEVTAVAPAIVDNKSVDQQQIDDFAKNHLKKSKEEQGPSSLFSTVIKVNQLLRGEWIVYLENGQKWQQVDTTRSKLKVGNNIRLDKGAMGAVYLYKEGSRRSIKVKRLK